jgi:hypothetical protein
VEECTPPGSTWNAPSTCSSLTVAALVRLRQDAGLAVVSPGTCTLTGGGAPSGTASGTGATSFCCAP